MEGEGGTRTSIHSCALSYVLSRMICRSTMRRSFLRRSCSSAGVGAEPNDEDEADADADAELDWLCV